MGLHLARLQFIAVAETFWNISSEGISELKSSNKFQPRGWWWTSGAYIPTRAEYSRKRWNGGRRSAL